MFSEIAPSRPGAAVRRLPSRPPGLPPLRPRLQGAAARWIGGVIAAVLLALVHQVWQGRVPGRDRHESRGGGTPGSVSGLARAVDGDTLVLGGVRIRLAGLDAPELAQDCEVRGEPAPCGRQALDALAGMARTPFVCQGSTRDQYDRLLATCSAGGRDVGAAMVRAGRAVAYGAYQAEEAEAHRHNLGVWAGGFQRPSNWRRDHRRDDEHGRDDVR